MTPGAAVEGWILFDAIEIDLAGRRLFVDGAEVALEPKAFAVLVLLASHPGRAFTRDEILDAVWGRRHITQGVLNRVVTLLRQALGDTAEKPRYLHTLHAVGYRFDGPAAFTASRAPAAGPVAPDLVAAAADTNNAPAAMASTASTAAPPAAPAVVRAGRRGVRPGILVALVVAVVGAVWWKTRQPAPAPVTAPLLVVLPLRAVDADPAEHAFADGLSEELTTRLAHIEGLRLISSTSSALARSGNLDAAQLAAQLHVTHALEGSLRQSADQLRIDLRLIETPSGRSVWAQDYDRKITDVFALQREIAQAVSSALSLSMGLEPRHEKTGDVDRFRAYLALRSQFRSADLDRACREGVPALRAIVAAAPDYAPTHGLLGRALSSNLCYGPRAQPGDPEEGRREAERALQLDPDEVDAHAALAYVACRDSLWQACFKQTRVALALDPTDAQTRIQYAYWLVGAGYLREAQLETEAAWFSDPLNYWVNFARGRVLDTLGRHDEARRFFDTMPALDETGARRLVYARWFNAVWRGDLGAARQFAQQMAPKEGFRDGYVAVTEALAEPARWPEATKLLDENEARVGRFNFARPLQPGYDPVKTIKGLEDILHSGFGSYWMMLWQPEYVGLRNLPEFQEFLRRTNLVEFWRINGWPAQCHAEGESAICD